MASKTGRRANAAAEKAKQGDTTIKDDGTRWIVVTAESGRQVYLGDGVSKGDAIRLSDGLVIETEIKQVS